MPKPITLYLKSIMAGDNKIISGLDNRVSLVEDPLGNGLFLRFTETERRSRQEFIIGMVESALRITCCHRYEPFWMLPVTGTRAGDTPADTQYLMIERTDGICVLVVPILDGAFRCSLRGAGRDGLELIAETGDPAVTGSEVVGLYIAAGEDPYELLKESAWSVMARMGTGRLRQEKHLPEFADKFGWCTWDAFYQEVSHEKVRQGLESFQEGGVEPRMLILDDGWQSVECAVTGEQRLTSFEANAKFSGDLGPTVVMAKGEFEVESFLVWHAMTGYWGGVDGEKLPEYGVRSVPRDFSPEIKMSAAFVEDVWGRVLGLVSKEHIYRFFQDYHRHLRKQGVDGVKVDTQATLEGVASGTGGRVDMMRAYHEALEGSVNTHFEGSLINCMSCSNDMFYSALNSNLTRTSTDFWPDRPESHGLHLYTNSQVSAWFGEFIHPDWDMFQSGHAAGAFHAAGRAVGGCPIYVSDKPNSHNFDLLRKLVLPDGSVLRCSDPGRPTRDCLFHDPTREDVLLKIFNTNACSGVVGVFNARYGENGAELPPIEGALRPSDVAGIEGERFAVYAHNAEEMRVLDLDGEWPLSLSPLEFEVFTISPIQDSIAPIGLTDMYNSGGVVTGRKGNCFSVKAGGRFTALCEVKPTEVALNEQPVAYSWDSETGLMSVDMPEGGDLVIKL